MSAEREYDLWSDAQDRRYAAIIDGKCCKDCNSCSEPGAEWENPERIGWCGEDGDFVFLDEKVSDKGCETFW